MTRKDYQRAAEIIRGTIYGAGGNELVAQRVTSAFIQFFQGDNPRFDKDRFREACMPRDRGVGTFAGVSLGASAEGPEFQRAVARVKKALGGKRGCPSMDAIHAFVRSGKPSTILRTSLIEIRRVAGAF